MAVREFHTVDTVDTVDIPGLLKGTLIGAWLARSRRALLMYFVLDGSEPYI